MVSRYGTKNYPAPLITLNIAWLGACACVYQGNIVYKLYMPYLRVSIGTIEKSLLIINHQPNPNSHRQNYSWINRILQC